MTSQDKWLLGLRIVLLACIITLAVLTVGVIDPAGTKAPLLTMMGGVTIVMTLYPPRVIELPDLAQDIIAIVGTGTAITGAFYWLIDAAQKGSVDNLLWSFYLAISLILMLGVYMALSMLILADWNRVKQTIKMAARKITRR